MVNSYTKYSKFPRQNHPRSMESVNIGHRDFVS